MAILRHVLFVVAVYGLLGLMGILGLPVVIWSRDLCYGWMRAYARGVIRLARLMCGIRVEIRGAVPRGAVIVAAKHQSLLDVLVLFECLPRAKFVMKRSLLYVPFFGLYSWRIGTVAIDRESRGQGAKVLREVSAQNHEAGQVVIYPQGTRVPPGVSAPYRRGAAMLYRQLDLPMVLAATNAGVFWPKHGVIRGPGTLVVEFIETLPPGLPGAKAMERMEAVIEPASARLAETAMHEMARA
ncbi:1-acyl-sn-glycerol-3-phosphate acyltransferase [Limibaculum sp. M0105]|uniref:1-acyl-sn-glycerol-3-phosphate acyltransferase n=1 Tax=Thermohalobaculum xanthum TaxID=2753746 RepID=A0A8J7M7Y7_9RHOB|nr:lysophospholipid acyltransferase family protein [Thermohalobaculum xanthum]MBK0399390.1 1-acyl-sn-glycerol-3-phosphate acyltransferase [Thermohalobaculum xanthum]